MSNILSQAGKGDDPRNCFSTEYRSEHDRIFGNHQTKTCPHGKKIGDDCPECLRALPVDLLGGTGINRKTKILPKGSS